MQAAGEGRRLGLGPKAFVELGGCTLLERAVATMLAVCGRVVVAVPPAAVRRAEQLVGHDRVLVIGGGDLRSATLQRLVAASQASWLLLHDAVRPFVTVALAQAVVQAARRSGAAAAALPNDDFLYGADGVLRARPHELVAVQKPIAFARSAILRGLAAGVEAEGMRDPSVLQVLARAGQSIAFVPGTADNIKISTPADYALARRIVASA